MRPVEEIPHGLVMCRVNGEDVTVTALSDEAIFVRRMDDTSIRSIQIWFLETRLYGYRHVCPSEWKVCGESCTGLGWVSEIAIADAAYAPQVRRVLRDWARYIRLKSEGDDEMMAHEMCACPVGEAREATLNGQMRAWFSGLKGFELAGNWSLALVLDRPELYERFADMPFEDFVKWYLEVHHLSGHLLFRKRPERVYIGNAYCERLCPDLSEIGRMRVRAEAEKVFVTAVLPSVRENRAEWAKEQVAAFAGWADEVEVNDLGMLASVNRGKMRVLLGNLLNRRRKDSRLKWKSGAAENAGLLAENALNDGEYLNFLKEKGICRIEYETCGYFVKVAEGVAASVHFPFYQTNTSHDCPLAAEILSRDAGASIGSCGRVCTKYARLYAKEMRILGRYNSIFGLDLEALEESGRLTEYLMQGADRLVLDAL